MVHYHRILSSAFWLCFQLVVKSVSPACLFTTQLHGHDDQGGATLGDFRWLPEAHSAQAQLHVDVHGPRAACAV